MTKICVICKKEPAVEGEDCCKFCGDALEADAADEMGVTDYLEVTGELPGDK